MNCPDCKLPTQPHREARNYYGADVEARGDKCAECGEFYVPIEDVQRQELEAAQILQGAPVEQLNAGQRAFVRRVLKLEGPLSHEEFWQIYRRVPRLCVEVVLVDPFNGVLLSKRKIEPFVGTWHLPGGTVRFGEPLINAVRRVAIHELGIGINAAHPVGVIEYPSHVAAGLDSPVSVPYVIDEWVGDPILSILSAAGRNESSGVKWCRELPDNTHVDQQRFISRFLPTPSKES